MKFCTLRQLVSCFWFEALIENVSVDMLIESKMPKPKIQELNHHIVMLHIFPFSFQCSLSFGVRLAVSYVTWLPWWPLKFENNFRWQEWWVGCQRSSGPWFSFFWLCHSALTETKIIWEFDLSPRTQDAGGDSGSHKGLFIGISKAKTVLSSWRGIQQGIDPTFGNSPISRHKLRRQGQKLAPRIVYTVLKAYEVS